MNNLLSEQGCALTVTSSVNIAMRELIFLLLLLMKLGGNVLHGTCRIKWGVFSPEQNTHVLLTPQLLGFSVFYSGAEPDL